MPSSRQPDTGKRESSGEANLVFSLVCVCAYLRVYVGFVLSLFSFSSMSVCFVFFFFLVCLFYWSFCLLGREKEGVCCWMGGRRVW